MKKTNIRLHYRYSYFWLIFWLVVFFPIGLVLLFTGSSFRYNNSVSSINYSGSRFWLGFWTFFFFPIAIALVLLNGFSAQIEADDQNTP